MRDGGAASESQSSVGRATAASDMATSGSSNDAAQAAIAFKVLRPANLKVVDQNIYKGAHITPAALDVTARLPKEQQHIQAVAHIRFSDAAGVMRLAVILGYTIIQADTLSVCKAAHLYVSIARVLQCIPATPEAQSAREHIVSRRARVYDLLQDRLVEYDRNAAKRTAVIDDQSDFFEIDSNAWLTPEV